MFTSPDFSRFIKRIGTNDLARPNLFLVRFGDFRSLLTNAGIVSTFTENISSGVGRANTAPSGGIDFTWRRAIEDTSNLAYRLFPHHANKILGASEDLLTFSDLFGHGAADLLIDYKINEDFAIMVKSVNLPSRTLNYNTMTYGARPFADIRGSTTGNITMTVYCSPNYIERRLMLMWMNAIRDDTRNQYGFQNSYSREIDIINLDRKGIAQTATICKDCFPVRVGEVQLDFDSDNQIATFEVEFFVSTQHQRILNTIKGIS
ncbi:TPA: hypothetical protein RQK61_000481 [Vibrio vulnificus]|nr:hypothetical protein [Vibrio vulnificus]